MQSYGTDNYTVYACYDFNAPSTANSQTLVQSGTFQSTNASTPNTINISTSGTLLSFPFTTSLSPVQAGALLQFSTNPSSHAVLSRFGVSFISVDQACSNAEEEVPDWDWDTVQNASVQKWEDVLERVQVDTTKENDTVVELLYSSVRFT